MVAETLHMHTFVGVSPQQGDLFIWHRSCHKPLCLRGSKTWFCIMELMHLRILSVCIIHLFIRPYANVGENSCVFKDNINIAELFTHDTVHAPNNSTFTNAPHTSHASLSLTMLDKLFRMIIIKNHNTRI